MVYQNYSTVLSIITLGKNICLVWYKFVFDFHLSFRQKNYSGKMKKILQVFETGLFWWVVFLFAFIPLYPKFPLTNVAGTFVAIRLEDIFITVAFLFWGISLLLSKKIKDFFQHKLNLALMLFFLIGIVSLFSANFLTHTVSPHLSLLHWARRVEFMMLMPIVATVVKSKKQLIITAVKQEKT